jgi:hypothetical protein
MLNEAGRDRLVMELQRLNKKNDHFHLDPDGMIDVASFTTSLQTVLRQLVNVGD